MKNRFLYALWGALFILCAGLGFIPESDGALKLLRTGLSILFFLPPVLLIRKARQEENRPALLIWKARQEKNRAALSLVRSLSIASLSLSAGLIIANFLTAFRSELLGDILHGMLVVVSSPMICSGHWAMSLFFWACLLIASLKS